MKLRDGTTTTIPAGLRALDSCSGGGHCSADRTAGSDEGSRGRGRSREQIASLLRNKTAADRAASLQCATERRGLSYKARRGLRSAGLRTQAAPEKGNQSGRSEGRMSELGRTSR